MRVYYMDALRSVLMLLGLVYHTAAMYAAGDIWRIPTPQTSPLFTWLSEWLHLFRMPAFFMISGYFCLLTLRRYGPRRFLGQRLPRLALPLLATAVLINPLMNYLSWDTFRHSGFLAYVLDPDYLLSGVWIAHLWFLQDLIVFFLAAALGLWLLRRPRLRRPAAWLWRRLRPLASPLVLLLVLPLISALTLRVAWRLPLGDSYYWLGLLSVNSLAEHLPYFLVGMLFLRHPDLLRLIAGARFWLPGVVLALLLRGYGRFGTGAGAEAALELGGYLAAWTFSGLCLALFQRLADRPSRLWSYLADASYSIYLFHQLFVVVFGLLLLSLPLSVYAKFGLVVVLALLSSAALHHFAVLRWPLLRRLFNGRSGVGRIKPNAVQVSAP